MPIYQVVVEAGSIEAVTEYDLVRMVKKHVDNGISSIVVHAGFTLDMLEKLKGIKRITGMVSEGRFIYIGHGCYKNNKENPFLSKFDVFLKSSSSSAPVKNILPPMSLKDK